MVDFGTKCETFVSVVIPVFNGIRTIPECLTSLSNQTYPRDRFEVLLVDNDSQDDTCEFVSRLFPWVKLVSCPEKGSGYARNAGIKEARGEFILSTDSDCVTEKDWIMRLVELLEAAPPEVAAIGGKITPYSSRTSVERYEPAWVSQPNIGQVKRLARYAATPNAAFRSEVLRAVGGFDGASGHDDTDLGIRLIAAGFDIRYTDQAIVRHRNPKQLVELYGHRQKYATRNLTLGMKHSDILGDPLSRGSELKLLAVTIRRVLGDLLVKLPKTLLLGSKARPQIWPLIDAVMAAGNFTGFYRAARAERASRLSTSRKRNGPTVQS